MKYFLIAILTLFLARIGHCQSFFNIVDESTIATKQNAQRFIQPNKYQVSDLNISALRHYLASEVGREDEGTILYLPNPDGGEIGYRIFETKMMEEGLAAKYPGIKTYKGYHPENKNEIVHLGISELGFYATVKQPGHTYSIDLYKRGQDRYYISYFHRDHEDEFAQSYTCGTTGKALKTKEESFHTRSAGELLPLREYRFAVATTGEFGSFYGPEVADVIAEIMKSVNRMNLALENDFAIRLILIADNDKIVFTDADSDPYPDGNTGGILLGQNTEVISTRVGFGNFDIGHVYTRGCDDTGGIANIESACSANKGAGVTCHYSNDITAMAIRVAAHEVGHQLGSNHTFNNCNGNENGGTAYEPGSGSTIMSYAGLCGSELNVISVADDYFHISSIIEVTQFTREFLGNNCPAKITTENHIPDIDLPLESGFSIPISTPFELQGKASDQDGDELTYTWEQFNLGPMTVPGEPVGNSPLFVSSYPSSNPNRVFPSMELIVANATDKREVLPSYERDLNFQFVVRDNNIESGGVAWEELAFYASASAGPFLVTFPDTAESFQVGEEIEITWDVANTNNEIVNCQSVNIELSTDGGMTYDLMLVERTPNDGQEKIFVPNAVGDELRIRIKAADNIFFDISNQDFTIEEPVEPGFLFSYTPSYVQSCVPDPVLIDFQTEGYLGYNEVINFEVSGTLPSGVGVEFTDVSVLPGEGTSAMVSFEDASLSGLQSFTIRTYTTSDTLEREIVLDLISSDFSDLVPVFPLVGSSGNGISPTLQWNGDSDAESYEVRLSDNPSFQEGAGNTLYIENTRDTFFRLPDILDKNTIYFWQIVPINQCVEAVDSEIYTFATEAISCNTYTYNDVPLGISQSGVIEIDMPIDIVGSGQVTDVNVRKIRGTHSWVSELRGELTSPAGTNVLLFRNKCGNQSDYNMGFDDDAVNEVTCPLNQGVFYQPEEKLDTFNGEEIDGEWIFTLKDTKVGNGGTVQEYILEVCSNAVLDGPELVTNEAFPLPSGIGRRLSSAFLEVVDTNNSEDELIFTIVAVPQFGTLRNGEDTIKVGSQFSQLELTNLQIRYQHDGGSLMDDFLFTVEDGEGGWISTTRFDIVIDNDIVLDVGEVSIPEFQVFPNPSDGLFNLIFASYDGFASFEVFDLIGQKVDTNIQKFGTDFTIDLRGKLKGIYLLTIKGDGFSTSKKLVVH